ncbi:hypothetical protein [Aegicerativicinus sediminis]|uniref:hypothetical protein n=1 Tax=Aegicerativicinus sediminis TaxID=2893202 RepID=UPI001E4E136A|nr:hypothetical protein [Aegicerativicinus sediminis]
MKFLKRSSVLAVLAFFSFGFTYAQFSTPRELRDLVDARASALDNAMQYNGYTHVSTSKSGGSSYSNWWNNRTKKCVTARTNDGRVASVVYVPNMDCNRDSRGMVAHENHRYDTNSDRYYHNERDNRYRHDNDDHHDRNYRYHDNEVRVSDLVGRGAEWSYTELRHRGFQEQKKHQDGGKTYRVFYNYRTHQCIKTLSQNKRISSIQNSTHCNQ